jgi:hypothetical protein
MKSRTMLQGGCVEIRTALYRIHGAALFFIIARSMSQRAVVESANFPTENGNRNQMLTAMAEKMCRRPGRRGLLPDSLVESGSAEVKRARLVFGTRGRVVFYNRLRWEGYPKLSLTAFGYLRVISNRCLASVHRCQEIPLLRPSVEAKLLTIEMIRTVKSIQASDKLPRLFVFYEWPKICSTGEL